MTRGETSQASMRSALLGLSTRIAEAQSEDAACVAVVEGLSHEVFGFGGVGVYLTGTVSFAPALKAAAGAFEQAADEASELRVPLRIDQSPIGELVARRDRGAVFERGDMEILTAAANQASMAIGRARLIAAERQRSVEQRALLDTLADLSGELELEPLLHAVLRRAMSLLDVTGGELAIYEPATEELVIVASYNMEVTAVGARMKLGEGAMGHVAGTREPLIIPRYQEWTGRSSRYNQSSVQTVMAAPLMIGQRLVGAIASVHSDPQRRFGEVDLRLLNLFAAQAAIAIENARLFTAERERATEQQALLATLADLAGELELDRVLRAVLERAVGLLGVTGGELAIYEEATEELVIVASHNMEVDATGARMGLGEGAMGHVARTHDPLIIPRYQEWLGRSAQYTQSTVQAVMAAPLMIGQRLVGAIASVHDDPSRQFGDADLRRLTMLAPQAAIAIENARLFAAAQRHYENLVVNNPVAVVNLDPAFRITACNPAFETLFGYAAAEVVGQNLDELVTTPETRAEAAGYTQQGLAGRMTRGTGRRRRKDGTQVDVELYTIPVVVGGEQVGLIAMYHDISELLAARRTAETANEAKSHFLASMSHELRTPLNAILGYSEMLQEDAGAAGQGAIVADLQKIHAAGKHLLTLINDVLDLSKIEAGKMELYLETFAVAPMLEDIATTVAPLVARNGNRLELEIGGGLGAMRADVTRVRQVLLNLLSNASKFTERGTIRLAARRIPGAAGEAAEVIVFDVQDSGIGMTEEQLGRLFSAFSQAEAGTSAKYGGTGLGLAISKKFCEMMGGGITVASTAGAGATFTVRLPVETPEASDRGPAPGVPAGEAGDGDGDGVGDAGTVLVIDDDATVRGLLARMLTRDGFRVVVAADGASGIALAREAQPDVITLDVMMPGMDGWGVLTALKGDPALHDIPVVMLTIVDEKNLGYALGAADYLTKPIERERLVAVLRRFTGGHAGSVLVVEDDAATRSVLRRTLTAEGWAVAEADNGRVALECLGRAVPALILLDLMMPEMDGFAFLDALRSRPDWRSVPVVVITAKDLTAEDHRRLNGGVQHVVQKGAQSRDELLAEVRNLVGVHAGP